jgi:tRNA-modifying protein YgfZ
MDKVQISDVTQQFSQIDLEGLDASDVLKKIDIESAQSIDEVAKATFMGNPVWVLGQVGFFGRGFRLVVPAASYQQFREVLLASGAVELSPESYHILRVESGLPAAGTELTDEYTPLEVGMEQAISDSKGCYPGQEVIARQVTYNKITQRFVRLKLHTPAFPGDRLYFEDKRAGKITSAVVSPRFGPRALAVVRKPYFEPGTILRAGEEGVSGTVE